MSGRLLEIARAVLFGLISGLLCVTFWLTRELYLPFGSVEESIVFRVDKGRGAGAIVKDLEKERIVRSPSALISAYTFFFSDMTLKAGEYRIGLPAAGKDVLFKILGGEITLHPVTIPEGLTGREIEDFLGGRMLPPGDDQGRPVFLRIELISDWDPEARDLEGYLYPDTYHVPLTMTMEDMFAAMVGQFRETFRHEWRKRAGELGLSVREVVTLASLIEKETGHPEERTLVSAVFHNRLRIGMKLDCDPTILYALKLDGRPAKRLLTRDLKHPSPYNTYLHPGLPPGPICNPGGPALEAALYPADADYLYFVSQNDGTHFFSRTFREHQEAVRRYQLKKK